MIQEEELENEFTLLDLDDLEETDFDKFASKDSKVENHFMDLQFRNYDITQNKQTQQWHITITLEQFSNKFIAFCTITINFIKRRIDCKSYIAKSDGQLIQVYEKYIQRLLTRYFCRINHSLRFGCFCFENETGQIFLKLNSIVIQEHWVDLLCSDESNKSLSNLLSVLESTSHSAIGYHIYRLMHQINKLSKKVFPFLEQKLRDQYRKVHPSFDIYLQKINVIIEDKCTRDMSEEEFQQFEQHFRYPKQLNTQYKILNKIEFSKFEQVEKCEIISDGELSIIQKGKLAFSLVQKQSQRHPEGTENVMSKETQVQVRQKNSMNNQDQNTFQTYIKKTVVIKRNKKQKSQDQAPGRTQEQPNQIAYEKKIIEVLSQELFDQNKKLIHNGYCPFISQYYMTDQGNVFQEDLFMDFYQHFALNNFREKFQATQSLNTRLYVLFQIAHALRYLFQYGVIHQNLTPQNVLITKNYNVKLKGFGRSIYKQGDQVILYSDERGTLPFASPESLSAERKNSIGHKSDIFSFGMLMYEFLFEKYPIDFKQSDLSGLKDRYFNKSYEIRSNVDLIKSQGPKHLMKYLRNLAVKCLHPDPNQRPKIEWIIICIREGLNYLEKMY